MTELALLGEAIELALSGGDAATAGVDVCTACEGVLPGEAASFTVMTSDLQRETVYAGDPVIAAFERAQFTVGEGPSLSALTRGQPVVIPSVSDPSVAARWPGLIGEITGLPVGSIFCFPMRFGLIIIGVCAFYSVEADDLSSHDMATVQDALTLTTLALVRPRRRDQDRPLLSRWVSGGGQRRRQVHRATGMVMGQLAVPGDIAFARLRGYAYAQGHDIEQVADDIVNRRLRLEPEAG